MREMEVMKFRGSKMFTWETDSAMRAEEVRYEWKIKWSGNQRGVGF